MKKTKIISTSFTNVNGAIKYLEDDGWEVVDLKNTILSNGELYIFLMAQKEADKSIYEKMYLLEQYCYGYETRKDMPVCKGCKIEGVCNKYIGMSAYHWNLKDVEKAYEVIKNDR